MKYSNLSKAPVMFLLITTLLLVSVIVYQTEQSKEKREKLVEVENMIKEYYRSAETFTILDYTYGKKDALISLVVLYKKPHFDSESNLLFVTDLGRGSVNLGADIISYEYLESNGVNIISGDTVAISLRDRATHEVYDFTVQYVPLQKSHVQFKVTSNCETDTNS